MKIANQSKIICLLLCFTLLSGFSLAEDGLTVQAITSSPGSLNTNFTLISGEQEAVLVDVPFLRSDAHRLVADIIDSGKTLTKIIITHAHPDHFFSVDVFKDEFPNVETLAHPDVAADFWQAFPARYGFWAPIIGGNAPRYPMIPQAIEGDSFELEGHKIEILGPMVGDAPVSTALWVPELKALVAGDIVFNQVHLYVDHDKQGRAAWVEALNSMLALNPETVVAGHTRGADLPRTRASLEYTRNYLLRFESAIDEADDVEEFMAIMRGAFPDAMDFVGDFLLTASANTAMAEKAGD